MAKVYTAQDMREMEKNIVRVDVMDGLTCREHCYPQEQVVRSMLRQAADLMEREERKKKYEYAAMSNYDGYILEDHCEEKKVKETFPCMKCYEYTVVRREVGEWEEVKDGE